MPLRSLVVSSAVFAACTVGGATLGALEAQPSLAQSPEKPNVVVIMTDDQINGEMSVMDKTNRTIGDEGISFDKFFSTYSLCCPSRATLLTGQYSHNHGVLGNGTPIGGYPDFHKNDNLASWLQTDGYHTVQVGKFMNDYPELDNPTEIPPGWDEWYASVDTPESPENLYYDYELNENGVITHYGHADSDYKTNVYGERALSVIDNQAASSDPLFMLLSFTTPHLPAIPARQDIGRFKHRALPRARSFNEKNMSDKPGFLRKRARFSKSKVREIVGNYRKRLESLLSVDRYVGRVMSRLETNGMLDNTYVIFLSDNGFFFGQHRLAKGKYLPYEPSVRTPILMRGPGIAPGTHTDELLANVDLAPTIADVAGAAPTLAMDGRSMIPYAQDPGLRSDRPVLLEAMTRDTPSIGIPYKAIRTQRYKYVRYQNGEKELYDLARDPGEMRSVHKSRKYARTRRALDREVMRLKDCAGAGCREPLAPIPPPRR